MEFQASVLYSKLPDSDHVKKKTVLIEVLGGFPHAYTHEPLVRHWNRDTSASLHIRRNTQIGTDPIARAM
jgi:hypothetical protein